MNTQYGTSDRVRVSGGHLCAQHRSTDRGGSRDLEPAATSYGSQNSLRLGAPMNFDRCATVALPSSAIGDGRALCLTPTGDQSAV